MSVEEHRNFVICVNNEGYEVSLERRKIYQLVELAVNERGHGLLQVIDESGEDYLYPRWMFVEIDLPAEAEEAFAPVA